jgi:hypothetical protein
VYLKGWVTRWDIFLSSERSNLYILYMRRWFSGCLFGKKNKYKDFACFYEKTTNFKFFYQKPHQYYILASLLCHLPIFSSVHPSLDAGNPGRFSCHRRLSELFSRPHEASGTILRVTGGFFNAPTNSLKRVSELLHIIIVFSMSKLRIRFHKNAAKRFKNQQHTYRKYLFNF